MASFSRGPMAGQAAVDFLMSYGVAILIVSVAIYVIANATLFNSSLVQPSCNAAPSFFCTGTAYSANGIVTLGFVQAVGGTITINGAACSTAINTTGDAPKYGNVRVKTYAQSSSFYPDGALSGGMSMYSNTGNVLRLYCYGPNGFASTNPGNPINGYVWLNFTSSALPSGYNTIERVFQFTARAT